ncbi:MAG: DivIVA domain-containing protein [Nocardioidaceae bacterium]
MTVAGVLAVVLVDRVEPMADVYDDRPDVTIPTGRPLTADDLQAVRFSTAVRGYRMDEVDALMSRLQADLLNREASVDRATPSTDAVVAEPAGDRVTPRPMR